MSLVDPDEGPYRSQPAAAGGRDALCTNRDLPLHMSLGQGRTDFTLESGAPVESIRCLAGPTPPRASHAHGDTSWRLISHLSLNYLSLVDGSKGAGEGSGRVARAAVAVRRPVGRQHPQADRRHPLDGTAGITRALPVPGPTTFGRGLEVDVTCDEAAFEGSGVFLLGAVLERFFAKYVSINSFTETVLRTHAARGDHAMAGEIGSPADSVAARPPPWHRSRCPVPACPATVHRGRRRATVLGPRRRPRARWRRARRCRAPAPARVGREQLLELLGRAPHQFDFFQVMRRLECAYRDRTGRASGRPRARRDEPFAWARSHR